jgi:hypothetical protein
MTSAVVDEGMTMSGLARAASRFTVGHESDTQGRRIRSLPARPEVSPRRDKRALFSSRAAFVG